jgi:DNA polymerase III subunit alpha
MPANVDASEWRATLFAAIESAIAFGQNAWNDKVRGQSGLFGGVDAAVEAQLPAAERWTQAQMSAHEKAALGFFLSVHPLDEYQEIIKGLKILNLADHTEIKAGQQLMIAGVISGLQVRWSKKGNRFATFRLEDQSSGLKCLMWGEAYGKCGSLLENDAMLIVEGKIESVDGSDVTMIVNDCRSLVEAVSKNARAVNIFLPKRSFDDLYFQELYSILNEAQGRCEVVLEMPVEGVNVKIQSGPLRVEGSRKLERELTARGCEVQWVL